jgi:hypothetical protein
VAQVTLQDVIADGSLRAPPRVISVSDWAVSKAMSSKLRKGDLLLSTRGRCGVVSLVSSIEDSRVHVAGWIPAQSFVIIRLRPASPISAGALFHYLRSPLGQMLLRSVTSTGRVPQIAMGDLRRLQVIMPGPEEATDAECARQDVIALRAQITELESRIQTVRRKSWPMTSR